MICPYVASPNLLDLQTLEQRLDDLEDENARFRKQLNLPPSTRPLLGKGPTGKDGLPRIPRRNGNTTAIPESGPSAPSPTSTLSPTNSASTTSTTTHMPVTVTEQVTEVAQSSPAPLGRPHSRTTRHVALDGQAISNYSYQTSKADISPSNAQLASVPESATDMYRTPDERTPSLYDHNAHTPWLPSANSAYAPTFSYNETPITATASTHVNQAYYHTSAAHTYSRYHPYQRYAAVEHSYQSAPQSMQEIRIAHTSEASRSAYHNPARGSRQSKPIRSEQYTPSPIVPQTDHSSDTFPSQNTAYRFRTT